MRGSGALDMQELQEALADLHLPHMTSSSPSSARAKGAQSHTETSESHQQQQIPSQSNQRSSQVPQEEPLPTIRILVVADVDLPSASALSEYTLQQKNDVFDASMIDLIIACGSFCRDEDLVPYLRGRRRGTVRTAASTEADHPWTSTPFFRTKEQTAALEGLMTAAISQLESIVCRVVYCPGSSDPLTTLLPSSANDPPRPSCHRRLTPNSQNVHRQWLPLAPGIGCTALLYLDLPERLVTETAAGYGITLPNSSGTPPPNRPSSSHSAGSGYPSFESEYGEEPGQEDENDEIDEMAIWIDQLSKIQQSNKGYCSTLERLLKLAPAPKHSVPFSFSACQSILITHYEDSASLLGESSVHSIDNEWHPVNGSPLWALEKEDKPWPVEHSTFLQSSTVQKLMCLEIASGSASRHKPELLVRGKKQILLPGSLRERGEFCILEVCLVEQSSDTQVPLSHTVPADTSNKSVPSTSGRKFAWNLERVDFHKLNRFRH